MKPTKKYINGLEENSGDLSRARAQLIKSGIYQTLGNFGPYFPNKETRRHKKIETFVIEDIEFTIIESEVLSFYMDTQSMSEPHKQREAWYQRIQ